MIEQQTNGELIGQLPGMADSLREQPPAQPANLQTASEPEPDQSDDWSVQPLRALGLSPKVCDVLLRTMLDPTSFISAQTSLLVRKLERSGALTTAEIRQFVGVLSRVHPATAGIARLELARIAANERIRAAQAVPAPAPDTDLFAGGGVE